MTRKEQIARAFGRAAPRYGDRAFAQRWAARRLADRIAALPLPQHPRVLEIGCGTGELTRLLADRLPGADLTVTDLSAAMVDACRGTCVEASFKVMDGEQPDPDEAGFDLICSALTIQWFEDLEGSLTRLCGLLKPGGWLAVSTLLDGTFAQWRAAFAPDQSPGLLDFAAPERLQQFLFEGAHISLQTASLIERHASGADFVRTLKAIGAATPAPGRRPLAPAHFAAVLKRFEAGGAAVSYEFGFGVLRRPARRGVFVTGTGTDVGKTVLSALLVRALDADYWKPVQTGTEAGPADAATVASLARLAPDRIHPSAYAFPAPLSPHAAAALEHARIAMEMIAPPPTDRMLVVEGAGGVLVPLNGDDLMIDLIRRLGLPVIVAAHSGLGTINHTLLTLAALRRAEVSILGVVMLGPPNASNREAIERHGQVKVLADVPYTDDLTPEWIDRTAAERLSSLKDRI